MIRSKISTRFLEAVAKSNNIKIASQTVDIVGFPEANNDACDQGALMIFALKKSICHFNLALDLLSHHQKLFQSNHNYQFVLIYYLTSLNLEVRLKYYENHIN
jgi:hypothetical protein